MNFGEKILEIDKTKMVDNLGSFSGQIDSSEKVVNETNFTIDKSKVTSIVISGLGGSAIGGDLLKTFLERQIEIPVFVNRSYFLPNFVSDKTLVIASSYSGNTEETISALKDALKRKAQIMCITTGGEIGKIAGENNLDLVKINGGLQPREALGYSFFGLLCSLAKMGFYELPAEDIAETKELLKQKAKDYFLDPNTNFPLTLAKNLQDKFILVYGSSDLHKTVAQRWKGQFCENAEHFSFANEVPEMNHNELVAFTKKNEFSEKVAVINLRDENEFERVQHRFNLIGRIFTQTAGFATDIISEGNSLLARTFHLIQLGDWTSYYLSILKGIDPTPVEILVNLKEELKKY